MSKELSIKSPRARRSDSVPTKLKILWKKFGSPIFGNTYHHTIIPKTSNHGEWILGAQPDLATIKGLLKNTDTTNVHIVSMLRDGETIISDNDIERDSRIERSRRHWFDHSVLDLVTGKNQTTQEMVEFQNEFYEEFFSQSKVTFYCHCMAGRSRSLLETLSFIYFCPEDKRKSMFDVDNPAWNKIREQLREQEVSTDLLTRLQKDPSFKDISDFVSAIRPKAKRYKKLDGDQAGLLGLMALDKMKSDQDGLMTLVGSDDERKVFSNISSLMDENPDVRENELFQKWVARSKYDLLIHASDIGLMLKAPLGEVFRDIDDRMQQEDKLISVFKVYEYQGINLLKEMIVPYDNRLKVGESSDFESNFLKLQANEQARFAVLVAGLEKKGLETGMPKKAVDYAKISLKKIDDLSADDQIELLKTFPKGLIDNTDDLVFYTGSIVNKILKGDSLDRYGQSAKLFELWKIVPPAQKGRVNMAVTKIAYSEQISFIKQLAKVDLDEAQWLAKGASKRYQNKWYRFFYNPLKSEMKNLSETISKISAQSNESEHRISNTVGIVEELLKVGKPKDVGLETKNSDLEEEPVTKSLKEASQDAAVEKILQRDDGNDLNDEEKVVSSVIPPAM